MPRITPFLALIAILPSLLQPARAQVVTDHLVGKYATTKEYCADPATQDFEIRRGVIEGPNLHCILGATQPPGLEELKPMSPDAGKATRCNSAR